MDLTGLPHRPHGYFQLGPGLAEISPLSRIKLAVRRLSDSEFFVVRRFEFKMALKLLDTSLTNVADPTFSGARDAEIACLQVHEEVLVKDSVAGRTR